MIIMLKEIINHFNLESPDEKVLLLPHQINPGIIKRNIALNYEKLSNLKIMSYRTYFVEKAVQYFPDMEYVNSDKQLWIVHNLTTSFSKELKYFNRYNNFTYYNNFAFEGNSGLLSNLFTELKLNFITSTILKEFISRTENKDKWSDILFLFENYNLHLKKNKLFDYADTVIKLNDKIVRFDGIHIIPDKPSGLEDKFIRSSGMIEITLKSELSNYELDAFKNDTVNQEAMQVTRLIINDIKNSISPLKIGVCVPDYNTYYSHFFRLNIHLTNNILFHFMKGAPFFDTTPGALWRYLSEWLANSKSIYRFIILLESGLLNYKKLLGDVEASGYYQSIKFFKKCGTTLFDQNFINSFKNYLNNRRVSDDDEYEQKDKRISAIALKIANSFDETVKVDNPFEILQKASLLLENLAFTNNELSRKAMIRFKDQVKSMIESLSSNINYSYNINELLIILNDSLAHSYISPGLPDYTLPVVGTESDLQYFEFDKLYILGLNEHGLPRKVSQNPLFLDFEKNQLSTLAAGSRFYISEDELKYLDNKFHLLKSTVTKNLILSAPLKDLESGRDKLVSRYFLEEWNRKNKSALDYKAMFDILKSNSNSLNNYIALNPADSIYDYELAVSVISKYPNCNPANILLNSKFPFSPICAKQIETNFLSFNEYWGKLDLDSNRDIGTISASRITSWVHCPYKYFLNYELRLEKMEDHDTTDLEWLTILDVGSFVHDLFHSFIMELREKYGKNYKKINDCDKSLLDKLFDEHIERYKESFPVISELHFSYRKNKLKYIADRFFQNEISNDNKRIYTELSFAMPDESGRDDILKRKEPAVIKLNDNSKILLRGSIDRVDQDKTGRFILIDYKTGKPKEFDAKKPFHGGSLAQAGLYSEIINQIDPKITQPIFRFYYTSQEGDFKIYELDYKNFRIHFLELFTAIITEMRRGNFVPKYNCMFCESCEYYSICVKNKVWLFNLRKDTDPNLKRVKNITEKEIV